MGLGLGIGVWWPYKTSIIPGLLKALCARATYCENKTCTTATLEEIAAVRYTPPPPPTGLLADYPGASAAYSLRNLIDTTTNVVRVRRSSDNTEQDFTSAEITDGTLTTFTGANDGFVTTWYDQSGNANNANQISASAQAKIVNSGILELENGKPCLTFDGVNDKFITDSNMTNGTNPASFFFTGKIDAFIAPIFGKEAGINKGLGFFVENSRLRVSREGYGSNVHDDTTTSVQLLIDFIMINGVSNLYKNSIGIDNPQNLLEGLSFDGDSRAIGSNIDGGFFNGKMQEFILYHTNQSANRLGIETNINTEYTIY